MSTDLIEIEPEIHELSKAIEGLNDAMPNALTLAREYMSLVLRYKKFLTGKLERIDPELQMQYNIAKEHAADLKRKLNDVQEPVNFQLGLLEKMKQYIEPKLLKYEQQEEQRLIAAQQAEHEAYGQRLGEAALTGQSVAEVTPPAYIPAMKKTEGGLTRSKHWTWRIDGVVEDGKPLPHTDMSLLNPDICHVPSEFWTLDLVKIGKAVRAGVKVPGIEIYNKPRYSQRGGGA